MRTTLFTSLLFVSLISAGCDRPEPATQSAEAGPASPVPMDESATTSTGDGSMPWDTSGVPVEGALISVKPNPASFCEAKTTRVEVQWDVAAANPRGLQLWLEEPDGKRKLWIAPRARQGSKSTGQWIREGSKIIAVDATTQRALAIIPIAAAPCH